MCSELPGSQWEEGSFAWCLEELTILFFMHGLRMDLPCEEDKSPNDGQQSPPSPHRRTEDQVLEWNSSKVNLVPTLLT